MFATKLYVARTPQQLLVGFFFFSFLFFLFTHTPRRSFLAGFLTVYTSAEFGLVFSLSYLFICCSYCGRCVDSDIVFLYHLSHFSLHRDFVDVPSAANDE
jgi:hypothetical protein